MIKIRKYKESDSCVLWSIFYHTIRNINTHDYSLAQVEAWAPDDFDIETWRRKMKQISPFVAELNGAVVGYADLQVNGLIDHFFCHHQFQRQGIGRSLMEHIFDVGKTKNITNFYSEVSITARPFYERFGFTVTKEQVIEVRGQKLRNFIMEKIS